jgi:hypothetical protein
MSNKPGILNQVQERKPGEEKRKNNNLELKKEWKKNFGKKMCR